MFKVEISFIAKMVLQRSELYKGQATLIKGHAKKAKELACVASGFIGEGRESSLRIKPSFLAPCRQGRQKARRDGSIRALASGEAARGLPYSPSGFASCLRSPQNLPASLATKESAIGSAKQKLRKGQN